MQTNHQPSHIVGPGVRVRVPTSLRKLPTPRLPSKARVEAVASLCQSLVQQAGMAPGAYTMLDNHLFGQVEVVYNGLVETIVYELSRLDDIDTCVRLYKRNEELLGWFQKHKYHSAADIILDAPERFLAEQDNLLYRFSPFSQAIRWLIEMSLKFCTPFGIKAGEAKLEYLIQLAYVVQEWDGAWEHIYHGVAPHEVIIGSDFSFTVRPTTWGRQALERYKQAARPYTAKAERDQLRLNNDPKPPPADREIIDKIMESPFAKLLNKPFQIERGYSMEDWSRFFSGLLDSFSEPEYCKAIGHVKLSSHLTQEWRLCSGHFDNLLNDYGLSKEGLSTITLDDLRPVERPRRDTRLLRRPIVVLKHNESFLYLYGIETLNSWIILFLQRLESGQIGPPIVENNSELHRAIGSWQTTLGNDFRDELAEKCTELGFLCAIEKGHAGNTKIPQGSGFGPVDVFVVDHRTRRFVLAEVKAKAAKGINPALLRGERNEFLDIVDKLEKQVDWFRKRLNDTEEEYGIPPGEGFTVEGVVVVNWPRLWMYTHHQPLPVVSDMEFLRMLRLGDKFVTVPSPVEPSDAHRS